MGGITASLPCGRPKGGGAGIYLGSPVDESRAWRRCDRGGAWGEGDYSRCPFEKDVTRILYIINQVRHTSTHTQTPLHTTHVGTGTANRHHSNGEVHVTTQYGMQCVKKRTQVGRPAP